MTKHFLERYKERYHGVGIPNDLHRKILERTNLLKNCNRGQSEMVCVIDFNKHGFDFYENEMWIIIREGQLVTTYPKPSHHWKRKDSSKVDEINYVSKWKK